MNEQGGAEDPSEYSSGSCDGNWHLERSERDSARCQLSVSALAPSLVPQTPGSVSACDAS